MQAQHDRTIPVQDALAKVVAIVLEARERRLKTNDGQKEEANKSPGSVLASSENKEITSNGIPSQTV